MYTNKLEHEVHDILVKNGYSLKDIEFRDLVHGDTTRHLRIGYWRRLSDQILDQLGNRIKTVVDTYDDDCGWLYYYELNYDVDVYKPIL